MLPPDCRWRVVHAQRFQRGLPCLLEAAWRRPHDDEHQVIAASTAQPWRASPTMRPKVQAQRGRDQEDGEHLHEVGPARRVLVGVRRVGVEEAAAVGAEHLDGQSCEATGPIARVCV
jgi:hypothetical protein